MGAGAGVTISSSDLGAPYMDGAHMHIPMECASLRAYNWACNCTGHAGELVVVGFDDEIRRLLPEEFDGWRDDDRTTLVRNRGVAGLDGFFAGYRTVELVFGGGWTSVPMEAGVGYEVEDEAGLGFGVDTIADITVRYDDGRLADVEGYVAMFPQRALFVPSERMARLYGFCREHWSDEDGSFWDDCIGTINAGRYRDDPGRAGGAVGSRNRKKSGPRRPASKGTEDRSKGRNPTSADRGPRI